MALGSVARNQHSRRWILMFSKQIHCGNMWCDKNLDWDENARWSQRLLDSRKSRRRAQALGFASFFVPRTGGREKDLITLEVLLKNFWSHREFFVDDSGFTPAAAKQSSAFKFQEFRSFSGILGKFNSFDVKSLSDGAWSHVRKAEFSGAIKR